MARQGEMHSFDCFIPKYDTLTTATGNPYVKTVAYLAGGKSVDLTFWSSVLTSLELVMEATKVVHIDGELDIHNGKRSIVVDSICASSAPESSFVPSFDVSGNLADFKSILTTELEPNYRDVLSIISKSVGKVFYSQAAATKYHDAKVGGLFGHTYKMLKLGLQLISNDARLLPFKSLLLLSIYIHDIGKIQELDLFRGYTDRGRMLTHRMLCAELLFSHKSEIVAAIGLTAFDVLVSVAYGHHNGLGGGEVARTVVALLVHMLDMIESQTTSLLDLIDSEGSSASIVFQGQHLYIGLDKE